MHVNISLLQHDMINICSKPIQSPISTSTMATQTKELQTMQLPHSSAALAALKSTLRSRTWIPTSESVMGINND